MLTGQPLYNGIEIDMIDLGDADCIVVTQWSNSIPQRVLIDGGNGGNADVIVPFLKNQGQTDFWSVVCTHPHNDHAAGLIKLLNDKSLTFRSGWMHDIRKHLDPNDLGRASAADDGVKQVVETTKELASAFAARGINPQEPFAGSIIMGAPNLQVLGPTVPFYKEMIGESTRVETPAIPLPPINLLAGGLAGTSPLAGKGGPWQAAASALGGASPFTGLAGKGGEWQRAAASALGGVIPPNPLGSVPSLSGVPSYLGMLSKSSVKESPKTQPFNNTSTILGIIYNGNRLLFTADAGANALDRIPQEWTNVTWMQVPHHGSDGNLSQENIERFCPQNAYISCRGDSSHPSRAIINGLIKVNGKVFSTHESRSLCYSIGVVPVRPDYSPAIPLNATGSPKG